MLLSCFSSSSDLGPGTLVLIVGPEGSPGNKLAAAANPRLSIYMQESIGN
jgi:hypothetical protein